ncbi:hypothetical protein HDU76_008969, partial [Blyttiomyces sp. JEL0837]
MQRSSSSNSVDVAGRDTSTGTVPSLVSNPSPFPPPNKPRYPHADSHHEVGSEPLLFKIAAGVTSGCLGSALANPTDLVKIRLQAEAGRVGPDGIYQSGLHKGLQPTYKNTFHAFYKIIKLEGFK